MIANCSVLPHWLQVCMEAKETQLQQEDDQIQQLGRKLKEKDTEIERQQKELQRLMVCNCIHVWLLCTL